MKDDQLNRIDCYIFSVPQAVGIAISKAIQEVMVTYAEEEKKIGQNPFAVTDPQREAVQGELWSIQIHWSDLKAIKAIGAGQFGEVYSAMQSEKGESEPTMRAVKLLRNAASVKEKKVLSFPF